MPPQLRNVYDAEAPVLSEVCADLIKVKKTVRIEVDSNEVFLVPHIDDMSEEEILTIWYDRPDYDLMKQSFIPILRKMMRGTNIEETDKETVRGLEYRTREGALKRQHNKVHSIHAVLDEQERQLSLGIHDVEKISEIYGGASQHCSMSARDLGEMDEEFVRSLESLDQSSHHGKPKKMGGIRKMIRHVRRQSLTWKSNRSLSSEKSDKEDPLASPASE
eukprot:scaffold13449_cov188-Amphora_coffeaeformis.AAC.2